MSAYIVSTETIDAIIYGARHYASFPQPKIYDSNGEANPLTNPSRCGEILLAQNYASVNYRYNEHDEAPAYEYTAEGRTVAGIVMERSGDAPKYTLADCYGALKCYRYQACETPNYQISPVGMFVRELIDNLAEVAIRQYGDIPWGIEAA